MHPRQFYERVIRAFSFSGEGEVYQPVVTVSLVARVVNHGYSRRLHILARSLIPPAYPSLHPGHDAALVLGYIWFRGYPGFVAETRRKIHLSFPDGNENTNVPPLIKRNETERDINRENPD